MSKEELVPINITFISHRIQIDVQKKITLQMVLYRNNKATKGQLKKFEGKKNSIDLQETLYFNSTLQKSNQSYVSKTINIKIACKVDSEQYQFQQSFNIAEYVKRSVKQHAIVLNKNPDVRLFYSFSALVGTQLQNNELQKKNLTILPIKTQKERTAKKIKFNFDDKKDLIEQNHKQNDQWIVSTSLKKSKTTCKSGQVPQSRVANEFQNRNAQKSHTWIGKQSKSVSKVTDSALQKQRELQSKSKSFVQDHKEKNKILQEQNKKLMDKNQILNVDIANHVKQLEEQERKIKALKNEIKDLQAKNKDLQQKNSTDKSDDLVNALNQKNKNLEKQLNQTIQKYSLLQKKYKDIQKNLKEKSKAFDECNMRIKLFSDKNVELTQKLAQMTESCDKYKQYSQQLQESAKKLRIQLKNARESQSRNSFQKAASLTSSNSGDKQEKMKLQSQLQKQKKERSILQQQLVQKQKLVKILTDCKNDIEKQKNEEIEMIRNQLAQLRNANKTKSSLPVANPNGMDAIQFKVNMEKNRKQIQNLKKNERSLMIQKNQLDSRNKSLQEQVIKVKEKFASLMNAINMHQNIQHKTAQEIFRCIE